MTTYLATNKRINPGSPQAKGLVGFWAADSIENGYLRDSIGNAHLACSGSPVIATGPAGTGFLTNGTSQYAGATLPVRLGYPFSIAVWFAKVPVSRSTTIVSVVDDTNQSGGGYVRIGYSYVTNRIQAIINDGTNTVTVNDLTTNKGRHNLHHVAIVCYSDTLRALYVDGKLDAVSTTSISKPTLNSIYVGCLGPCAANSYAVSSWIDTYIRNVAYYKTALTGGEVWSMFVNPEGLYLPTPRAVVNTISAAAFKAYFVQPYRTWNR